MWNFIDEVGSDLMGWTVGLLGTGVTAWLIYEHARTVQQGLLIGATGAIVTLLAVIIARHNPWSVLWWWWWWW